MRKKGHLVLGGLYEAFWVQRQQPALKSEVADVDKIMSITQAVVRLGWELSTSPQWA